MTYSQIRFFFIEQLSGVYSANELEGIWNLCLDFILHKDKLFFITNPEFEIPSEQELTLYQTIERVKHHEPFQYIVGKAWFCDLIFKVNSSVLIPRPETEELVYNVCDAIRNNTHSVLDIGTGSGCIAISIKNIKPQCSITAVDISIEALQIASHNSIELLKSASINFIQADALNVNFCDLFKTKFDIIVSNPPYIPSNEKESLPLNVINSEPHLALFCTNDPLQFYKAIVSHAENLLNSGGLLFFEVHENFANEVLSLFKNRNFRDSQIVNDIHGKNRMVRSTLN